jgi:hypothetical protein
MIYSPSRVGYTQELPRHEVFMRPMEPWPVEKHIKNSQVLSIICGYPDPPAIRRGDSENPLYCYPTDCIEMPDLYRFRILLRSELAATWRELENGDELFLFSVLFHELAHSTGHSKRLNRTCGTSGWNCQHALSAAHAYFCEEVVAQHAVGILMERAGLVNPKVQRAIDTYAVRKLMCSELAMRSVAELKARGRAAADWIMGCSAKRA